MSPELNLSIVAERLKQERLKRKLTQLDLAELCGLNIVQINRYEAGAHEPSLPALMKLSTRLGVSIDYLVGNSDEPHGKITVVDLDLYERELIDAYRKDGWPGVFRLGADRIIS